MLHFYQCCIFHIFFTILWCSIEFCLVERLSFAFSIKISFRQFISVDFLFAINFTIHSKQTTLLYFVSIFEKGFLSFWFSSKLSMSKFLGILVIRFKDRYKYQKLLHLYSTDISNSQIYSKLKMWLNLTFWLSNWCIES